MARALLVVTVAVVALLVLPSPGMIGGANAAAAPIVRSPPMGTSANGGAWDPPTRSGAPPSAPPAPWTVDATLSLINGTVRSGNRAYPSWFGAGALAYDTVDEKLFVETGSQIQAIDPSTMQSTGSLGASAGFTPGPMAYASTGDLLYVTTPGAVDAFSAANGTLRARYVVANATDTGTLVFVPSADVLVVAPEFQSRATVLNLSDGIVTDTVSVGSYGITQGIADPAAGVVFLGNATGGTIEEFSDSHWNLVRTISIGGLLSGPEGLAVDTGGDQLYATEGSNPSVLLEIAVANGSTIGRRTLGSDSGPIQFDPVTGALFVGDGGNESIYTVDPVGLGVTATIPFPLYSTTGLVTPMALAEAPALGTLFAALSAGGNRLDAISVTNRTVYRALDLYPVPEYLADDSSCGCYAVGDSYSDALYFVNRTTFRLERTVELPAEPQGLAYASRTGDLWIAVGYAPYSTEEVLVVYGSNGTLRASLPDPEFPVAVAYDAGTDQVFVANNNGHAVSVFNASSRRPVVNVSVGTFPLALVDLPSAHEVFVANQGSANVSVINATSDSVTATVAVGADPGALAYDAVVGLVLVPHIGFRTNVTPINASSDTTLPGFPAALPTGVTADTRTGSVVVANLTSNVSVWDPSTANLSSFPLGYHIYSLMALPGGGFLAGDGGNGALYLVGAPQALPLDNATFRAQPFLVENGSAAQWAANASAGTGPLTFRYAGLPPGCASANATSVSCSPTRVGTYPTYANISDTAGSSARLEAVVWTSAGYPVWVNETGLPAGTEWWLNLSGQGSRSTAGVSINLVAPNGTYAFVATPADAHLRAVAGSFSVLGGKAALLLAFPSAGYTVTFDATGLPYGIAWGVGLSTGAVARSVTSTASLDLPNGTFGYVPWSVDPTWGAAAGLVYVAGAAVVVSLTFAPVEYPVRVTAQGLPTGTGWYVTIPGHPTSSSTSAVIAVNLTNASYTFSASSAATGARTINGTFVVDGAPVDLTLSFAAAAYSVTFQERGLVAAAPWWANVTGVANLSSTAVTIGFTLVNGTYAFSAGGPAGTMAAPSTGHLTIAGAAVIEAVNFTSASGTVPALVVVGFAATPDPVVATEATNFTVTVSGGVTPYSFSYTDLPGGCVGANAPRLDCRPSGPGAFDVFVTVRDPAGQVTTANTSLTVLNQTPCACESIATPQGPAPTWGTWEVALLLVGGVALGLVIAVVALRRRRRQPPPTGSHPQGEHEETPWPDGAGELVDADPGGASG